MKRTCYATHQIRAISGLARSQLSLASFTLFQLKESWQSILLAFMVQRRTKVSDCCVCLVERNVILLK